MGTIAFKCPHCNEMTEEHYHDPNSSDVACLTCVHKSEEQFQEDQKHTDPKYMTEGKKHATWRDGNWPFQLKPTKPDSEYDGEQLRKGMEVELEHTGHHELAKTIAKHHLDEFPEYYKALAGMEKKLEKADLSSADIIPKGGKMKKPVGWFVVGGNLKSVLAEEGQDAETALKEEAKQDNIEMSKVKRGEPPENWKEIWEGKNPGSNPIASNVATEMKTKTELPKTELKPADVRWSERASKLRKGMK